MKTLFAGLVVLFTMSGCVSIPQDLIDSGRVSIGPVAPGPGHGPVLGHNTHNTPVDPASQAAYDKEMDRIAKMIQKRKDCIARNKAWTDHGQAPRYRCGNDTYPIIRSTRDTRTNNWRQGYPYRSAYDHKKHDKKRH